MPIIDYKDPRYTEYSSAIVSIDWDGESPEEPDEEEAARQRQCWAEINCPTGPRSALPREPGVKV